MLPQKKNADIGELARGKAGRLIGNLTGFLAVLKGLPLSYNRDLQEDKEPLFDAVVQINLVLKAVAGLVETLTWDADNMANAVDSSMSGAIDLAEFLVARGLPFREAHGIVGRLVGKSLHEGVALVTLVEESSELGPEAAALLGPGESTAHRQTPGGAGVAAVAQQLERLTDQIALEVEQLNATQWL